MHKYAEIVVDLVSNTVVRPFHYSIPDTMLRDIKAGMRVTVPFGKRVYQGYVLRLLEKTDVDPLRDIISINDREPLLNAEQLSLACWISFRYYCRLIDAIHAIIPASFRRGSRPGSVQIIEAAAAAATSSLENAPAQAEALQVIMEKGPVLRSELLKAGIESRVLRNLEKKGLIRSEAVRPSQKKEAASAPPDHSFHLRGEQASCLDKVKLLLGTGQPERILLHGITASGKTEIYMQSISCCLDQGRTALVLVPEIALTPQMIDHFERRFPGQVAVLHSRLTAAEKKRHWLMISEGEARIVLGARSAIFAPLDKIGLIVIDEEHETTYKQEETPRYHARDVAWWRARYHKGVLLTGSATPSLESYNAALEGRQELLTISERVTPGSLPPVEIVDMREEMKENHRHIFSRRLIKELDKVMEHDEQAILFINRRGFSGFVLCRECGYVVRCPSCAVSLTLHLDRQLMCCHYCGYESAVPVKCPSCGGIKIRYFSAGTERVENETIKLYPAASIIRMDSDTTATRLAHSDYYRKFRDRQASILIGTQMIAKGFDFPGVTLVGVVAADTALNLPDFRAPERTFQLLTQVAGRTGRGAGGGRVIIQTYHPDHYSIDAAAGHDYNKFYQQELDNRRQLSYPPFSDMIRFLFSGSDETGVFEAAAWLSKRLEKTIGEAELLGPAPASLYRVKNMYRVQTIAKGEKLTAIAPAVKKNIRAYYDFKPGWPVRLTVDFNPMVVL